MKRIISLITVLVLTVSTLSACSVFGFGSVPSSIDSDGRFVYAIVRAQDSEVAAETAMKTIRNAIKDNFGCNISVIRDLALEDFDGNYEILIGDTNREESAEVKQKLLDNRVNSINDFIVAVVDDKIVIQAANPELLATAGEWFAQTFCQSLDTWAMLKNDYEFIYEYKNAQLNDNNTVSGKDLGTFKMVLPVKTSYLVGMYAEEYAEFYSNYGYEVELIEDIDAKAGNEIIIGDTTREESKAITVEGDNYVIKVVNGNVVIKGGSDLATWRGIKAFYDEVIKLKEGKALNWSEGFTLNGKYDKAEEGTFTLNWNDEFEGSSVDFNKWGAYSGMINSTEKSSLGGTKCWQSPYGDSPYTATTGKTGLKKLIYQADGNLHIGAQRLNDVDFVGGQISTCYTMIFRYGIFEVRSKLPPEPCALGYWINQHSFKGADAVFTKRFGGVEQSRLSTAEIDIIENFGSSTKINANVHRWWSNDASDFAKSSSGHDSLDGSKYSGSAENNKRMEYDTTRYSGDLSTDYHYYSMYWTDEFMKFTFDGKTFLDYRFDDEPTGVGPYCLMSHFITECQMGDVSYGKTYNPDEHGYYYEHIIDYVRIYQSDAVNCQLITAWPEKQATGKLTVYYPEHPINSTY